MNKSWHQWHASSHVKDSSTNCSAHSAMDTFKQMSPETKQELNTPFHMAKWNCFFQCFPITEPVDKLFFLFGADVEEILDCNIFSMDSKLIILVCWLRHCEKQLQFSTLNLLCYILQTNSVHWIGFTIFCKPIQYTELVLLYFANQFSRLNWFCYNTLKTNSIH